MDCDTHTSAQTIWRHLSPAKRREPPLFPSQSLFAIDLPIDCIASFASSSCRKVFPTHRPLFAARSDELSFRRDRVTFPRHWNFDRHVTQLFWDSITTSTSLYLSCNTILSLLLHPSLPLSLVSHRTAQQYRPRRHVGIMNGLPFRISLIDVGKQGAHL